MKNTTEKSPSNTFEKPYLSQDKKNWVSPELELEEWGTSNLENGPGPGPDGAGFTYNA